MFPELRRALQGTMTQATQYMVRELLRRLDQLAQDLLELDAQIAQLVRPHQQAIEQLSTIPGLGEVAAAALIAEIGTDMSVFPSAKHLASWGGLAPGSNESAGKNKRQSREPGDKYLRTMLVQFAWVSCRLKGSYFKQKFSQLIHIGRTKAIMAIVRKLAVTVYYILRDRTPYREPLPTVQSPEKIERLKRKYVEHLQALGFDVALASHLLTGNAPASSVS